MEIFGSNEIRIEKKLVTLFNQMKDGNMVKSVTCMSGTNNVEDSSKDFKVENFYVETYFAGSNHVITDKGQFYMEWVRSFELY